MNCQRSSLSRIADPQSTHAALVLRAVRRGPGRGRARRTCSATRRLPRPRRPIRSRPKQPHFAAQGQARHLPVHGRRAEPSGAVRQQAAAGEVRRHAAARRSCSRAIARRSSIRTRSCWARSSSSPSTASAAPSCRELLPHLATIVDDIAIVKSMVTDAFNHAPGQILMNTGSQQFGRPSMGAWVAVRPGQRVAGPARLRRVQLGQEGPERRQLELGQRLPADGLPGRAVPQQRRSGAVPVEPAGRRRAAAARFARRRCSSSTRCGSTRRAIRRSPRASTPSRWPIRMQASAPELMDISQGAEARPGDVRRRAGQAVVRQQLPAGPAAGRARRALRAALPRSLGPARQPGRATCKKNCQDTDQACAALVKDLKQRGLLDDTLVIWGGEFGRTPMVQGGNDGRDHHPNAFTMWLAAAA